MDTARLQRRFVADVLPRIQHDPRVAGIAVAGSLGRGNPDLYSDVDIIVVIDDSAFATVMCERLALIDRWTSLVVGFTGEHVGEPRLIITLVGPPLLHADFKFVRVSDFAHRDEDPVILWEKDNILTQALNAAPPVPPPIDLQWIEDRFWVWVHYGATKLGRGELFEVLNFLNYLREAALVPLIMHRNGALLRGLRHLETRAPAEAVLLRSTVCSYHRDDAGQALLNTVDLYRRWRDDSAIERRRDAETLAVEYLHHIVDGRAPS